MNPAFKMLLCYKRGIMTFLCCCARDIGSECHVGQLDRDVIEEIF